MGVVKLRDMADLIRWRAELRVVCNTCGREARFDPAAMLKWFRSHGWSTALDVAAHRFRCDGPEAGVGCGSKDARLSAFTPDLELPEARPKPKGGDHDPVPLGIWLSSSSNCALIEVALSDGITKAVSAACTTEPCQLTTDVLTLTGSVARNHKTAFTRFDF